MLTFLYCAAAFIFGCIVGGVVISKLDFIVFRRELDEGEKAMVRRVDMAIEHERQVVRASTVAFFVANGWPAAEATRLYDAAAVEADMRAKAEKETKCSPNK